MPKSLVLAAVQEALEKANGVVDRAVLILTKAARTHPKLYRALCDPYLDGIARDHLNAEVRQVRHRVSEAAEKLFNEPPLPRTKTGNITPPEHRERVRSYGRSVLMFWPLPGGRYLKDAASGDLSSGIEHYTKQANTETRYAAFLTAVRAGLHGKQRVADVFDEDKLNAIWKKAGL